VVAAAVIDTAGRVLIAQRPAGRHLAGGWEFPGGKLDPGEARAAGLQRELHEELGIVIETPRPLIRVRHAYPTRDVLLDVWVVTRYRGEPRGLDGQELRWMAKEELATAGLLPADKPAVAALRLPERLTAASSPYYCIAGLADGYAGATVDPGAIVDPGVAVDGGPAPGDARLRGVLCAGVDDGIAAAGAGADFLVMRDALPERALDELCEAVMVPVFAYGIGLERAWELGASGVQAF
jgi:mutator protein MutT